MVRWNSVAFIVFMMTGILLAVAVNPVAAVGTISDGYEYNDFNITGTIYEHNPVTMQDTPKAGVIVRLYGTDNNVGLHTTNLVKDLKTDSRGNYKFTIRVGTMKDSFGNKYVRSAHPYYQITCYNDAGSEYEIYDIRPECGRVGETLGSSLKWVTIEPEALLQATGVSFYLFPCENFFYVHKKGQPLTVTAPAGMSMGEGQVGIDLKGSDYRTEILLNRVNPKDCSDWCLIDSKCRAATYVKPGVQGPEPRCWLKTSVPASSANTNTVSFIKYDSSNPLPTKVLDKFENVDLKGSDYDRKDIPSKNPEDCAQLCLNDPKCSSATYVKPGTLRGENSGAVCFLKNSIPSLNANINTISWVKHPSNEKFGWSCFTPHLTPSFTASPSSGKVPLTVTFTDTSLGALSRNWDLDGDGDYDNYDTTTTYNYSSAGTYRVRLTVGGCPDSFESITKDIIVEEEQVANVGSISSSSNPSIDPSIANVANSDSSSKTITDTTTGKESITTSSNTLTCSFAFDSNPAGASVSIDGTSADGVTPLTVSDVAPGSHTVVFTRSGFEPYSRLFSIQNGELVSFTANLVSTGSIPSTTATYDRDVRSTTTKPPGFIWIGALAALAVVVIFQWRRKG